MNIFKHKVEKLTTINSILTHDDITKVLSDINAQSGITDLICVFRTNDGATHFQSSPVELERAIFLLERTKQILMEDGDD